MYWAKIIQLQKLQSQSSVEDVASTGNFINLVEMSGFPSNSTSTPKARPKMSNEPKSNRVFLDRRSRREGEREDECHEKRMKLLREKRLKLECFNLHLQSLKYAHDLGLDATEEWAKFWGENDEAY